jgi:predicted neuraminidase
LPALPRFLSLRPLFWLGWLCLMLPTLVALSMTPAHDMATSSAAIDPAAALSANTRWQRAAHGDLPMPPDTPSAHASSLVALSASHPSAVAAVWFAGSRESGADVQIAYSSFDRRSRAWKPAQFVLSREALGQQLGYGVRRLGNPVLWRDGQDRLHLFVVATGLGGWAASRVAHLMQVNAPNTSETPVFRAQPTLPLSWLWNTSHLVRNAPLPLADGGMALPIYFELGIKYPMLVRLSKDGHFQGLTRISARRNLLQPALAPVSTTHWLAYMRMQGGAKRVAVAESHDAGRHWTDLPDLSLPNPNASVAALRLGKGLALAFNPSTQGRQSLSLATSGDDLYWQTAATLEDGNLGDEFSYPALAWADDALWVSYTNRRQRIAWQRFVPTTP